LRRNFRQRQQLRDGWGSVGGVADSGEVATVFNWRIADNHTYFVGTQEWGFSVWAHNSYNPQDYGEFALEWAEIDLRPNRRYDIEKGEYPSVMGAGVEETWALSAATPEIEKGANYLFVVSENGQVLVRQFGEGVAQRGPHSGLLPNTLADQQARVAGEMYISEDGVVSTNLKSGHFMRDNPLTPAETALYQDLMAKSIEAAGFTVGEIRPDIEPVHQ
jgi:hypothetical protein